MAVSRMQKVALFFHQSEKEDLIQELHRRGRLHICDFRESHGEKESEPYYPAEVEETRHLEALLNDLEFAAEFLNPYVPKGGILSAVASKIITLSPEENQEILQSFDGKQLADECRRIDRRFSEINTELNRLHASIAQLQPWMGLDAPFGMVTDTQQSRAMLGAYPSKRREEFHAALEESPAAFHLEKVGEDGMQDLVFLVTHKDAEKKVSELLKQHDFTEASFPGITKTPQEEIQALQSRKTSLEQEREALQQEAKDLAPQRSKLLVLVDHYIDLLEKTRILESFAATSKAHMIEGWLQQGEREALEKLLQERFQTARMIPVEPLPGEEPPVSMQNALLASPFEVVVDLYGRPKYTELDPTAFVAPFFAVFFAICLTDGGYGLVLVALSYLLLKKVRLGPGSRNLMTLLFFSGILTFFAGLVTGSFFGLNLSKMDSDFFLVRFAKSFILFDPVDDALIFFVIALSCGVIHVFVGFFLRGLQYWREGRKAAAILSAGSWMLNSLGLGLIMINFISTMPEILQSLSMYAFLVGLAGIILFNGIGEKSAGKYILKGFGGLYDITGVFSDILSYSRLLALGLATSVVAGVIDTLGALLLEIPILGIPAMILLLIVGHIVYLAISCLGAFVHTARLTFVEFFGKFYEGGGVAFAPFQKKRKYTILSQKSDG